MISKANGYETYQVLKLAQYLTGLTIHQDVRIEIGKALVTFFSSDMVAFGERCDGDIVCHHWTFSDRVASRTWSEPVTKDAIIEVLESGFLSTRLFSTPEPLSVLFLPITQENLVTAVMLVGYQMSEPFSKELLEVYLAVSGLVGTTTSRLVAEKELREHRKHLEELVKKRTSELTDTNEKLHVEIVHRMRSEAIIQARLRLSEYAPTHSLNELLTRTLDEAEALTGSTIGFFHYLKTDQKFLSLQTWSTNTLLTMCTAEGKISHYPVEEAGVWADCVRQRQPIIHNDYASLPNRKGMPQGHAVVLREMVMPILRGELIVGVIGVGNKPTDYVEQDIEAVSQLANMAWDIVVGKRAQEEKLALEQQLRQSQKLESLGVLAGGIAHDFNNILAVIIGYCGLIKMNYEKAENHIQDIENAAERAAELCRQMLDYAGKSQHIMTQVNMWMLVNDLVDMLKSTLPQNAIIKSDLSANIPSLIGDISQLRQIVMNLIINASEAIGKEQGEIQVTLAKTALIAGQSDKDCNGKLIPPGEYVCLEVSDNGCGMDNDTKLRIFEPFYTTKFTGRGLGMSAVLGIIKSHSGSLQFFSQLGQGTTFKVYLPVQASNSTETDVMTSAHPALWQGSGSILLVEDEDHVRTIAKILLKKLGFTVLEAVNGKEALELYQKNATDITLVMTDMGMPVMDGYELFSRLKNLNNKLPIIVSSGFGDAEVTSRIAIGDIAGIISKPYNYEQLREVLKTVLEGTPSAHA